MPIKVVIADDHEIVRTGITAEIERTDGIEVVAEARTGDEAYELTQEYNPDVLVLDINMPGLGSIQAIRQIKASRDCRTNILALTVHSEPEYVIGAIDAGATGYLLKKEELAVIVQGIRIVSKNRLWLSNEAALILAKGFQRRQETAKFETLTPRELDVLRLVGQGYDNTYIRDTLCIAEGTVRNHITNIYAKLNLRSRAELVAWAWRNGIVSNDDEPS